MKTAALFTAALFAAISAQAADGDADPTYAGGTVVTQSVPSPFYQSYEPDTALAADGSLAVIGAAGTSAYSIATSLAVAKFRSDGAPDYEFGNFGIATVDFSDGAADYPAYGRSIAALPDGRWLLTGRIGPSPFEIGVARLFANGQLDLNYGTLGRARIAFSGSEQNVPGNVLVDGEQRAWILVSRNSGPYLVRLTPAGTLDANFGDGGKLLLPNSFAVTCFTLDLQGRILLGGVNFGQSRYDMAVRRLLPDGGIDTSFGDAGVTLISPDIRASAQQLRLLPDGRIVVAGNSYASAWRGTNYGRITVARLLDNGRIDTTFGQAGVRIVDFGSEDRSSSSPDTHVAIGTDGKVTIGRSIVEPVSAIRLTRLLPNGQPDAAFAPQGKRTLFPNTYSTLSLSRVLLTPTRLILSGTYNGSGVRTFFNTGFRDGDGIFRDGLQ
ncbi:hypothetical protein ACFJIW_16545 [Tahibacter sp. UC22_41]|uniref:hypothetical protein n=1 Tax=Tahibacter sp. UC22_41 TaxID=3350178 RepID=UPI0036DD56B5